MMFNTVGAVQDRTPVGHWNSQVLVAKTLVIFKFQFGFVFLFINIQRLKK